MSHKMKFTLCAGALIAEDVKAQVRAACFQLGVNAEIKDFGGLITKSIGIEATGDKDKLERLLSALKKWVKEDK